MNGAVKTKQSAAGKYRKRQVMAAPLMITSMLDILTTILFFLLKNYSYVTSNFAVANDLKLPKSSHILPPPDSVLQLVVTKNAIMLDQKQLVVIKDGRIAKEDLYRDGVTIVPLAQALEQHKKRSKYMENNSDKHSFTGTIVLQADKELQFKLLKKVLYTTGITDYVNLKLAVLKKLDE